jgi:hypothetical protein
VAFAPGGPLGVLAVAAVLIGLGLLLIVLGVRPHAFGAQLPSPRTFLPGAAAFAAIAAITKAMGGGRASPVLGGMALLLAIVELSVMAHEAGHWTAASVLGAPLRCLQAGLLRVDWTETGVRWRLGLQPRVPVYNRVELKTPLHGRRLALFAAGGPLTNAAICALSVVGILFLQKLSIKALPLYLLALSNGFLTLGNLWPNANGFARGVSNDGHLLASGLGWTAAGRRTALFQRLYAAAQGGQRLDEAGGTASELRRFADQVPSPLAGLHFLACVAALEAGEPAAVGDLLDRAERAPAEVDDRFQLGFLLLQVGRLALLEGAPARARACLASLPATPVGASYTQLAEAAIRHAEAGPEAAAPHLARFLSDVSRSPNPGESLVGVNWMVEVLKRG